jgi:sterol desaturase/sphingolipid hydroxylase (fatty acid hydroxylase superfamily)
MLDEPNPVLMFGKAFFGSAANYFVVAGLVFLLFWKSGWFQALRIPQKARSGARLPAGAPGGKQLRHEMKHTLITLLVGTCSAVGVMILYREGMTKLTDVTTPLATVAWVCGLILFNDAWFYFWHRLLHHPRIYRYVHTVHHKSVDVNPFSSYSFHAGESFILGAWIIPAALLFPIPVSALGVMQAIGMANNVMSHLGFEIFPAWLRRAPPFSWMNSATFHSAHHTSLKGNYGLFFRGWDKLFGTELPE